MMGEWPGMALHAFHGGGDTDRTDGDGQEDCKLEVSLGCMVRTCFKRKAGDN